jgi:hypothetical protein
VAYFKILSWHSYSCNSMLFLGYQIDELRSISRKCRDLSLKRRVQTGSGAHLAFCPMGTGDEAAGALN